LTVLEKYRIFNPEVLYSEAEITTVDRSDVDLFKQQSSCNPRKRIRLCAHGNPDDRLHEMLIVHDRSAYVRPHKHLGKTESTHIIEGLVDVVMFDDDGQIARVISMGDYSSGRTFYYRMATPVFHTLIIRSDVLVFHETTNGPFDRKDTVFAPWAPEDSDINSISTFMSNLDGRVRLMQ
jgi:cupin fold WbuC family metalloprotein